MIALICALGLLVLFGVETAASYVFFLGCLAILVSFVNDLGKLW